MPGSISEEGIIKEDLILPVRPSSPTSACCKLGNRCSISSVDSSISLSYDAAPFTPRGSLTGSNEDSAVVKMYSNNNKSSGTESSSDAAHSESEPTKRVRILDVAKTNSTHTNSSEEENSYEPPDDELVKKIVDQVEYYFSDENIVKDAFLLKHVRRNKEGYVSLKLIASFKRVKHIAKDWRAVREALQKKSTKLAINDAGTKLRRLDPLPLFDQTTPSRTVVAINVSPEKANIENIAELFRPCGEIALVRILRPGNPIPADVRPFYNKHPEMHGVVSALVEFVRTESAHNALNKEYDSNPNSSSGSGQANGFPMQVLELNAPPKKRVSNLNGKKYSNRMMFDSEFSSSCQSGSEAEDMRYKLRMQTRRCSSPHISTGGSNGTNRFQEPLQTIVWNQPRRWSRDSGSESPGSNFSRSRSNSGAYCSSMLEQGRRMSAGWESSSESYGSCRSRSSSGVSIPDIFAMRRYSLSKKDHQQTQTTQPEFCCCGHSKCESQQVVNNNHHHHSTSSNRRYSFGRNSDTDVVFIPNENNPRRGSNEYVNPPEHYRKESYQVGGGGGEFYCPPQHRNSFEQRRPSFGSNGGISPSWSRQNSGGSVHDSGRRLSTDSDGGRIPLMRQRSFSNTPANIGPGADSIIRMPRGPDGGRGFQRDLIEYALPE